MSAAKSPSIQLIPLLCTACKWPVPAQVNEVAWVCEQCGQGLILDPSRGAVPQPVFFSNRVPQGKKGRPFWVLRAWVNIRARLTYRGNEEKAARAFWGEARLFYIPAWDCSLDELLETGKHMLKHPEGITPGPRVPFLPVVTLPTDLQALGEFLVLSIEAERKDALKTVEFDLRLDPPQLWILP